MQHETRAQATVRAQLEALADRVAAYPTQTEETRAALAWVLDRLQAVSEATGPGVCVLCAHAATKHAHTFN